MKIKPWWSRAGGIGKALAERFAADGAKRMICADLDGDGAERVVTVIGDLVAVIRCFRCEKDYFFDG